MNNKEFKEKAINQINKIFNKLFEEERNKRPNSLIFKLEKEMGVELTSYNDVESYVYANPKEMYNILKNYVDVSNFSVQRNYFGLMAALCNQIDFFDFIYEEVQREFIFAKKNNEEGVCIFKSIKELPKGYALYDNQQKKLNYYREEYSQNFSRLSLKKEHLDKLFILISNRLEGSIFIFHLLAKKKYPGIFDECRKIINDKDSSDYMLWCAYRTLEKNKNPDDKKYFEKALETCIKRNTTDYRYNFRDECKKVIKNIEAGKWTKKEK